MLRACPLLAHYLYLGELGAVGKLSPSIVARMYTSMVAPTPTIGEEIFRAWEALPGRERMEATSRMRLELAKVAPRGSR